ncbi:MAG: acyl-CoA dehydrogenase family protein [Bdellovibrionota bacterium]
MIDEIRDSVRKLAIAEIPKYQNENFYGSVPLELFKSFAGLGLTGLTISENFGGLGLGPTASAAVLEEISSVDLGPAIFLSVHLMVSGILERSANQEQKEKYLTRLASGELLAAFALTESSAGSDASALKTRAEKQAETWVINGDKCWISSAGWADIYLVFAKTNPEAGKAGISAFIVEANTPGLTIGKPEKKMGCELSPISTLQFENMKISEDQRIGELNHGYKLALSGLAGGRISIAACANGLSRTAIELAKAHLQERQQFGKKLIEFQGLQFMLADLRMQYEASKLLVEKAASILESNPGDPSNRLRPSIAKCFATDAAMKITTDAVQLLGGAGYVHEYQVERLMRDAKMLQIVEGTNQIQRMVIAREMLEETV